MKQKRKKKPKKVEWVRGRRSGGALWDRRLKGSGLDYKCILRKKRGRGGRCAHINLAFFPFKLHLTAAQLAQGFQDRLFSFFFSMSLMLLCWKSDSLNPT